MKKKLLLFGIKGFKQNAVASRLYFQILASYHSFSKSILNFRKEEPRGKGWSEGGGEGVYPWGQ